MVDPNDAKGFKVPVCMLASGDENPDDVEGFKKNLSVESHVETFKDQLHGWMAARYVDSDPLGWTYQRVWFGGWLLIRIETIGETFKMRGSRRSTSVAMGRS